MREREREKERKKVDGREEEERWTTVKLSLRGTFHFLIFVHWKLLGQLIIFFSLSALLPFYFKKKRERKKERKKERE